MELKHTTWKVVGSNSCQLKARFVNKTSGFFYWTFSLAVDRES